MIELTTIIVSIFSVGFGSIITGLFLRRERAASASSQNVQTALDLMDELKEQLETERCARRIGEAESKRLVELLSHRIDLLENRENEYVACLKLVIEQIEELGVIPVVSLDHINQIASMEVHNGILS